MSKYTIKRDIALLNSEELIEIFVNELNKRIFQNKEELIYLENVINEIEKVKLKK